MEEKMERTKQEQQRKRDSNNTSHLEHALEELKGCVKKSKIPTLEIKNIW